MSVTFYSLKKDENEFKNLEIVADVQYGYMKDAYLNVHPPRLIAWLFLINNDAPSKTCVYLNTGICRNVIRCPRNKVRVLTQPFGPPYRHTSDFNIQGRFSFDLDSTVQDADEVIAVVRCYLGADFAWNRMYEREYNMLTKRLGETCPGLYNEHCRLQEIYKVDEYNEMIECLSNKPEVERQ